MTIGRAEQNLYFVDKLRPHAGGITYRVNVGTFGHCRVQVFLGARQVVQYCVSNGILMPILFKIALKQFCHENMIKTLINPRYSDFGQTAGTIGQLLVHSDIQAGTIGQQQKRRIWA